MSVPRKSPVILGTIAILCVSFGAVRFFLRDKPPLFEVDPSPQSPRILSTAEVEQILQDNFIVVRKVSLVPDGVKQDYAVVADQRFWMVNPGRAMSTDAIIPGIPNKRLIFAGVSGKDDVLVFEVGAFADSLVAIVGSHGNGGGTWVARLNDYSVHDVVSLTTAIKNGQFTPGLSGVPGLTRN